MSNIGLKIKLLASKKKIDATDIAERIGISKQAVYGIYNNEDIHTKRLREISEILEVPITYFFNDEDCKQTNQEELEILRRENESLKKEIDRLQRLKFPTSDEKAFEISMKFFEVTKEMFDYCKQIDSVR